MTEDGTAGAAKLSAPVEGVCQENPTLSNFLSNVPNKHRTRLHHRR